MLRGVRNIVFHHSLSVTRTISLVIKSKADIGNVIYTDPTLYKNQPWKRQQATSTITKYAIHSGLDENGAETAELGLVTFVTSPWCLRPDEPCLVVVPTPGEAVLTSSSVILRS